MSNDISKIGVAGVIRLPAGNIASKFGVAAPIRLPLANITTKFNAVAVMRLSTRDEITKFDAVAVLRVSPGITLAADEGSYAIIGGDARVLHGRVLKAYNNLILNGDFPVDTSHWTVSGADTTFDAVGGQGVLALGSAAAGGYAYQAVSVVPGQRYTLSALLRPTNAYRLAATPGSYSLNGTPATLTVGSSGGGGGGSPVTFSGDSIFGTKYAVWTLGFDGYIYKQHNSGAAVQAGPWIVPQIGMSNYEVRATLTDGNTPSGVIGTWSDVGGQWGFTNVTTDHSCDLLIEIRNKSDHTVIASGNVSIFAAGTA